MTRNFWLTGWKWQIAAMALALSVFWSPVAVPAADLTVDGGATLTVPPDINYDNEAVGFNSTGTINQTGGTNSVDRLYLGQNFGASGTYNLSSGTLRGSSLFQVGHEYIGYSGTGTFSQTGGTNRTVFLELGFNSSGSGTYDLQGGDLFVSFGNVGNSGTGNFTQSGGINDTAFLFLGLAPGASGSYQLSGTGSLKTAFTIIGVEGTGTFSQTGGTHTVSQPDGSSRLTLGEVFGGSGTYNLQGGTLLADNEIIGSSGTGTFNHGIAAPFGGTNTVSGSLYLGGSPVQVSGGVPAGSGTYNLQGGTLTAQTEYIGYSGTGTFFQSGGTNTVSQDLVLGQLASGVGTYFLGGSGILSVTGDLIVGNSGAGIFNHGTLAPFPGISTVNGNLYLGGSPGQVTAGDPAGSGNYNLAGDGSLEVKNSLFVGYSGTGTFTQTGGTNTVSGALYLGYSAGDPAHGVPPGTGTYNLGGTGSLSLVEDLVVGEFGTGTFTQNGGSLTVGVPGYWSTEIVGDFGTGTFTQSAGTNSLGSLWLGKETGSSGTYELSGGSLSAANAEIIGFSGTGTFTQTGGTNTASGIIIAAEAGSSGTYNLSGSGSLSAQHEYIGQHGTGTFTQTGGTNAVTNHLIISAESGASGTYNLGPGATLSAGVVFIGSNGISDTNQGGTGTFNQTGGTHTITGFLGPLYLGYWAPGHGTYNLSNGSLSSGAAYLGYFGSGTFNQSGGTHSMGGGMYIGYLPGASGTYNLSGTGSLSCEAIFIADPGGTGIFNQTGGTNTIGAGGLTVGGDPGSSGTYALLGGSLSVAGNYTQTARGTLEIGFASGWYGKFDVGGSAVLAGTVRPVLLGGYLPPIGVYDVITSTGGRSGEFDLLDNPQITPIKSWEAVYGTNSFALEVVADFTAVNDALTPNQQAVGNMLEGVAGSASGDLFDVLNIIGNLPTAGAIADAYQQISPDKAAALPNLGFAAGKLARQTLGQRITDLRFGGREMEMAGGFPGSLSLFGSKTSGIMLAYNGASLAGMAPAKRRGAATESRWGLWFDPAGVLGDQKSTVNQTGYDFSIVGFNAGVDYRVQDNVLVGLTTGYSYTDADFKGSGGSVTSSTWPITAYAAYLPETWYAVGSLGYALNLFDLERQLSFGGLSRTAKSSPTGHQFNAYGEAGYDFKLAPFVVTPTVSLAYSYISVESFTESGADSLNLKVGAQNADSLQTGVGAKVAVPLKTNSMKVVPQVYATYQHEFLNDSRGLNARLSGAGNTFNFTTDNPGRDFAVVGGNVTVFKNNLSGYVNYNAEVGRSKYTAHYIGAGLRYQF